MAGCQPPDGAAPVPSVRTVKRKNELGADHKAASEGFPSPDGVRAASPQEEYPTPRKRTTSRGSSENKATSGTHSEDRKRRELFGGRAVGDPEVDDAQLVAGQPRR